MCWLLTGDGQVVAIHNAVNEQTWKEVMKWEKLHCDECQQPKVT